MTATESKLYNDLPGMLCNCTCDDKTGRLLDGVLGGPRTRLETVHRLTFLTNDTNETALGTDEPAPGNVEVDFELSLPLGDVPGW